MVIVQTIQELSEAIRETSPQTPVAWFSRCNGGFRPTKLEIDVVYWNPAINDSRPCGEEEFKQAAEKAFRAMNIPWDKAKLFAEETLKSAGPYVRIDLAEEDCFYDD